jgi:hypothetical protein
MEKLCYALWRRPEADIEPIAGWLVDEVAPRLQDSDLVLGARVLVEAPEGGVLRMGANPDGGLLCGAVSVWLDSYDERAPVEDLLAEGPAPEWHGWLVAESVPLAYGDNLTWEPGERSPGLSITTIFDKRTDVDDADFYRVWHTEHTPLSFEIHPLWLYVRNQVMRPVTDGAPSIRAFVYEAVPTPEDMLDLHRFFGSGGDNKALGAAIDRVNGHVGSFADMTTLQTVPMHEYLVRRVST